MSIAHRLFLINFRSNVITHQTAVVAVVCLSHTSVLVFPLLWPCEDGCLGMSQENVDLV